MTKDPFTPLRLMPFDASYQEAEIDLLTRCYAEYGQRIELETLDEDLLAIPSTYVAPASTFQILVDRNRLVGSIAVKGLVGEEGLANREAELKRVFLEPDYRGRGLGKALSNWAFAWASAAGYEVMHIWSDVLYETAHGLYRGLGAVETGEIRNLGGINEVKERHFLKTLPPRTTIH